MKTLDAERCGNTHTVHINKYKYNRFVMHCTTYLNFGECSQRCLIFIFSPKPKINLKTLPKNCSKWCVVLQAEQLYL